MPFVILRTPASKYASVGGGADFTDGQTFTMAGSGFGTNANIVQAMIGGPGSNIEAASNGTQLSTVTLPSGWALSGSDPTFVVTSRALNGTRSILHRHGYTVATGGTWSSSNFQYGMRFDVGVPFKRAVTIAASYKTGFTLGQVKFQRFTGRLTDKDGNGSGGLTDDSLPNTFTNCYTSPGQGSLLQTMDNAPANGNLGTAETDISLAVDPSWVNDGWVQQHHDFVPGTIDTADGSFAWRYVDATNVSTVLVSSSATSKRFWRGSDNGHRYWIPQFFMANEAGIDGAQLNIDSSCLYGLFNTANSNFPKFIFAGNASTYAACTKLVPQQFISWADTSITGTFNKGQLAGLTPGTHFWMYAMSALNTSINSSGVVPT